MSSMLESAVKIIRQFEGEKLKPYRCSAGKLTIGVGHVIKKGEEWMMSGIDAKQSAAILAKDLETFVVVMGKSIKVHLSDARKVAVLSLMFNIGANAFINSTVLRKINQGDIMGAGDAFLMWNRAGGKVNQGLVYRREKEREIFVKGIII